MVLATSAVTIYKWSLIPFNGGPTSNKTFGNDESFVAAEKFMVSYFFH